MLSSSFAPCSFLTGASLLRRFTDDHNDYVKLEVAVDYNAALIAGTVGIMSMPAHFWDNVEYCEKFPIRAIDFANFDYAAPE